MHTNLLNLVNQQHGSIPVPFLLGWIQVESGGRIGEVTSLNERGYFQLHPGESSDLRLDHNRLSTDPAYSVEAGIKLIQSYQRKVERLGFEPGTNLYWHMVKFEHAMGAGNVNKLLQDMRAHGVEPSSWETIQSYAHANESRLFHDLHSSPSKWIHNVDEVFSLGQHQYEIHQDIFQTDPHHLTPGDANTTNPDGHAIHNAVPETDPTDFTEDNANFTNQFGNEIHVTGTQDQTSITPGDANFSNEQGKEIHVDQGDQNNFTPVDANSTLPDGATVHFGANIDQSDSSQQTFLIDSNISLPDGATVHHGADSNQIDLSQQLHSIDSNISLPDGATVHHGADINQVDHSQQNHSTDSNISLPDGATVYHGADSNQIDLSQQLHSIDSNINLPDGATVHHGADSNQVDHSQQSHVTDNSSGNNHDDGSQSFHA